MSNEKTIFTYKKENNEQHEDKTVKVVHHTIDERPEAITFTVHVVDEERPPLVFNNIQIIEEEITHNIIRVFRHDEEKGSDDTNTEN